MATKNLVPRATGEGSLGTAAKKWGNIYADNITLQDGETLATKISSQNSRITTAEGTVTTLSGDVTSLYSSVDELSSGKVNKENPADSEGNTILTEADALTLEEIEASTSLADTDVASASALKVQVCTIGNFCTLESGVTVKEFCCYKFGRNVALHIVVQLSETMSASTEKRIFKNVNTAYAPINIYNTYGVTSASQWGNCNSCYVYFASSGLLCKATTNNTDKFFKFSFTYISER